MSKLRVLVVDDSAFMRRIIRQMLETDPEIEVIGSGRDGAEGVELAASLQPDVITMDVEMPRMNGLEATGVIMEKFPTPILMVSSLTTEGAHATFEALDKGAADYISKNLVTSALDMLKIQDELIAKIKALGRKANRLHGLRAYRRPEPPLSTPSGHVTQKIGFVAIGASTGGPRAIQEVLSHLPGDIGTPFLVAVHMPKAFTGAFAERLNSLCKIPVKEAEDGEKVTPGRVFLTPGGTQTRIRRRGVTDFQVEISNDPFNSLYKPSVDIAMTSVAESFSGRAMGVILTGMGHDGLEGMRAIKETGGKTIAQNEESCTVYGMPKAVVEAGLADKVAPLDKIAAEIVNMI
ncbi:MAG: chemotaxis response regulator protein-glutamate methylesterase [Deltaproteobacteria bacterium]|nr:chemotaxis response regulator protein-glutamate methylesterase [Deltaproteobacteria bacterium]